VALRNLALIVFGPFPLRPPSFVAGVQQWGPLTLTNDRLVAGGVGLLVLMAVVYIMSRTAAGHALDAVSQSRESAAIVGIDPRLAYTLGFGLGGALAGAAGAPRPGARRAGACGGGCDLRAGGQQLLAAHRDRLDDLRHSGRELGAAGRLRRAVLVRAYGLCVAGRLYVGASGAVDPSPHPAG